MNKIMCWVINESLRCGCWCLCLEGSVSNDLTAQAEKKRHIRFFFIKQRHHDLLSLRKTTVFQV